MVQANTINENPGTIDNPGTEGNRDGRVAVWLNGDLIMDFPNMLMRHGDIKINEASVGSFAANNNGPQTYVWYDNVVIATEYIGPAMR
jgi:hypothetical protein